MHDLYRHVADMAALSVLRGVIPESIMDAFDRPDVFGWMEEHVDFGGDMADRDRRFECDVAVTRILAKQQSAVIYACKNDEQSRRIKEATSDDPGFSVSSVGDFLKDEK